MPTYEYRCDQCGTFETFQRITDDPLRTCPTCGGNVHRLISKGVGLVFKGSGWHITDYRKGSNGAGDGEGAESESKSASKSEETAKV